MSDYQCNICHVAKPSPSFAPREIGRMDRGRKGYCRECDAARQRRYRALHRDEINQKRREMCKVDPMRNKRYANKSLYNLTASEVEALRDKQGGKCAICGAAEELGSDGRTLMQIDHCHKTGKVRGLLCHHCNSLLGRAKDKIEILEAAIEYLKQHG